MNETVITLLLAYDAKTWGYERKKDIEREIRWKISYWVIHLRKHPAGEEKQTNANNSEYENEIIIDNKYNQAYADSLWR